MLVGDCWVSSCDTSVAYGVCRWRVCGWLDRLRLRQSGFFSFYWGRFLLFSSGF